MLVKEVIEMLELFQNMNPLIIDVAIVAILVLVAALAALRGIKKVSINIFLLSVSLFLGFSSLTQSLKDVLGNKVLNLTKLLPAGSTSVQKFAISLVSPFVSSFALFLLIYFLLLSITILITMLIKRKMKRETKQKSVVGRVFAGIISFVYSSALCMVLLLTLNNNLTGMKEPVDNSTIAKFIADNTENLLEDIDKDLSDKVVIKLYNGNVLFKVEKDLIDAFEYMDDKAAVLVNNKNYISEVENDSLTAEESKQIIKEKIGDLHNLAIISMEFGENDKNVSKNFVSLSEEWITTMNRSVVNNNIGKIDFIIDEIGEIKLKLKAAGVKDTTMVLLNEIIVEK